MEEIILCRKSNYLRCKRIECIGSQALIYRVPKIRCFSFEFRRKTTRLYILLVV